MRPTTTLLTTLFLAASVPLAAQEEKSGTGTVPDEVRQAELKPLPGSMPVDPAAGETVVTADGSVKEPPAETNLLRFVAPVFSTKPHRLAPGQTGTLVAVLSLQGNAVMVPGMQVAVSYEPQQGEVALGQWAMLPAKPCTLYPKFKEQDLYEKYAQIEIPVSIAAGAKHGKHTVKLAMTIEITDGQTGAKLGVPRGDFPCEIVVGEPVPQPAPLVAPATAGGAPATDLPAAARAAGKTHAADPLPETAPRPKPRALEAGGTTPAADARGGEAPGDAAGASGGVDGPAPGGGDMLLFGILGVAGLALAGIVIARLVRK
jgi:hypothetical protein